MSKKLNLTLVTLLAAACSAFAQFEGQLEMKMTLTDKDGGSLGGGTMNIAIAKAGVRSEMNMQRGPMGIKMVMLKKTDTLDKVYNINDAARTYSEVDLTKVRSLAGQQQQPTTDYTVEKLGEEKLLGYTTQHVLVKPKNATAEAGQAIEMWTAKDFMDYETFSRLQSHHGRASSQEGMAKALKDAGAEGMPLRSVSTAPDGAKSTMEVVKAEKKSLPASTFEIPAGYTKSEGGIMEMMGNMTGPQAEENRKKMEESNKKMNEALKNMTPEQRQMFENMMKQRGAQHP
jgi:hypothetical protein